MVERTRLVGPLNGRIEPSGRSKAGVPALALPILAKTARDYSEHAEDGRQRKATSDRQPDDGSVSIREISERAFHVIV